VGEPPRSRAEIAIPDAIAPKIALDQPGRYLFELTVQNGEGQLDTAHVSTYASMPQLEITSNGQEVTVAGPADAEAFDLESSNGKPAFIQWHMVETPATVEGALKRIRVAATQVEQYFHLRKK
jgi:hypothetical protein